MDLAKIRRLSSMVKTQTQQVCAALPNSDVAEGNEYVHGDANVRIGEADFIGVASVGR